MGIPRINPEREQIILDAYAGGATAREAAALAGCSQGTCFNVLHRYGLQARDASVSRQRHAINQHFFDEIDTEEKAYILGFIAADGNISRGCFSIRIAERDEVLLQRIRVALDSGHPIKHTIGSGKNKSGRFVSLSIGNRQICAGLKDKGIHGRKSFTIQAWGGPEHLMRHYWRGAVDGDGWITYSVTGNKTRWELGLSSGSQLFLEAFADFVWRHLSTRPVVVPAKNIFRVRVGGKEFPQSLAVLLYKDATISLVRKHRLADELMATECKRSNRVGRLITFGGKTQRVCEWAAELGVNPMLLHNRLRIGLPLEKVLTESFQGRQRLLMHEGQTLSLAEWSRRTGIKRTTITARLDRGLSVEDALSP